MQQRQHEPRSISSLLASDIFGQRNPLHNGNGVTTERQRRSVRKTDRSERRVFTDESESPSETRCIWPYITREAFAATLDNYRQYIYRYNQKIKVLNAEIERFNAMIDEQPKDEILTKFAAVFIAKNCHHKPIIYNQLADEFNNERGLAIKKKPLPTVKYTSEKVFQEMLHVYAGQLAARSSEFIRLGITEPTPIPMLDITSSRLTGLRRGEAKSIDVCNATIRNHRARLEEAGVLIDYTFRGHKSGVRMRINPEILVVFDGKTQMFVGSENQCVSHEMCKKVSDNNEATRALNNNIKNNENADGDSPMKGTPQAADDLSLFYKNIPTQGNFTGAAAPESVKISGSASDKLYDLVEHPQELATKLADGHYNGYSPIDIRILRREAYYGTLSREQFQEVVIQDFMKTAARLYRGSTPFPGSWKVAYTNWIEKRFFVSNGNGKFLIKKDLMVDLLQEYRWRLANAEKWFRKTGIKPLYPSHYFDFTRTDKKEIGFEYTRKAWLTHLKYLESKPKKERSAKKAAEARKQRIDYSRRYENQINRFFRNRITFDELFDYVRTNLPVQYQEKLHQTILNAATARIQFSAREFDYTN